MANADTKRLGVVVRHEIIKRIGNSNNDLECQGIRPQEGLEHGREHVMDVDNTRWAFPSHYCLNTIIVNSEAESGIT